MTSRDPVLSARTDRDFVNYMDEEEKIDAAILKAWQQAVEEEGIDIATVAGVQVGVDNFCRFGGPMRDGLVDPVDYNEDMAKILADDEQAWVRGSGARLIEIAKPPFVVTSGTAVIWILCARVITA